MRRLAPWSPIAVIVSHRRHRRQHGALLHGPVPSESFGSAVQIHFHFGQDMTVLPPAKSTLPDLDVNTHARIVGLLECFSCLIQRTAETWSNCHLTRNQRRNQVLTGTCRDNGVVGARNGWTVIGRDHEYHFNELGRIGG